MGEVLVFSKKRNELIRMAVRPPDERTDHTVERLLSAAAHEKISIVFLFFQIDRFEEIAMKVSERKLRDLASKLIEILLDRTPEGVYVDTFGRNEFLLVLPRINKNQGHDVAVQVCQRFVTIAEEILKKEKELLGLNIGMIEFPEDVDNRVDLFRLGREAMFIARNAGANHIVSNLDDETQQLTVTITDIQFKRLHKMAEKENVEVDFLVREVLDLYLR